MTKKSKKKAKIKKSQSGSRRRPSAEMRRTDDVSSPKSRKERRVWIVAIVTFVVLNFIVLRWGGLDIFLMIITTEVVALQALLAYRKDKMGYKGLNRVLAISITLLIVLLVVAQWYSARSERMADKEEIQQLTDGLEMFLGPAKDQFRSLREDEAMSALAAQWYEPVQELLRMLSEINTKGGMPAADVLRMMVLTRQLIRSRGVQAQYPVLNFYCEWCTDYRPYGMYAGSHMLLKTTEILFEASKRHDPIDVEVSLKKINEALSLEKCRTQFRDLYASCGLPIFIFEHHKNWKELVPAFLNEIYRKPIELPEDLADRQDSLGKMYARLREHPNFTPKCFAKRLWFEVEVEGILQKGTVLWVIQAESGLQWKSSLQLGASEKTSEN